MACSHIPVISYTQWSRRVYKKSEENRVPLNGIIELTYRCSFKCAHCYIVDYPIKNELSYRQVCAVIDQIAAAGCLFLLLTGGEPLLRKDFLDIYLYAKKKGLLVTVFTNGSLLTGEIADCFAKYPPFTVEITLYGITEETHAKVTKTMGSLDKVLNGINLLRERNIPFKLKTMLMSLNIHELALMKQFSKKFSVAFRYDACITPRLDGSKNPCRLRISPGEIVKLDSSDKKRAKEWRQVCKNYWGSPKSDERYQCGAGVTSFVVNPAGEVKMCSVLGRAYTIEAAAKKSFIQGWNKIIPVILAEKRNQESVCNHCQIFSVCDRCAAHSKLETGHPDSPVPFFCDIAKLRSEAFGSAEQKKKLNMKGESLYGNKKKEGIQETVSC